MKVREEKLRTIIAVSYTHLGQEEAILFSSGFGANAGILRAFLGQNDIALIGPYIHTSAMAGLKGTNISSNPQLSP